MKKFTSIVVGKSLKDKNGRTLLERIIVHEIRLVNDVMKSDSKLIFKGKKQSVIVHQQHRETKLKRNKVQGINLLTGESLYQGGER